ncbi:MAG: glutamate racemase [Alphaproteobacteria bacterium]|nr:glutamate racemase [Alphaproteobacteria bacterium]
MKIGVFDSGLGGLVITKALIEALPQYDYLYYGDSAHLPYGDKTSGTILNYTLQAMKYMIARDCKLIIIACNTATAITLRYIQQRFIPSYAPDIKVLGVVIPTVETAILENKTQIGVIATNATVRSKIYTTELLKLNAACKVTEIAAPELVPAIESNDFAAAADIAHRYSEQFRNCQSLILGCTHYPLVKEYFRRELPNVSIISQDELMGAKLADYLRRHPEIENALSTTGKYEFIVSRTDKHSTQVAEVLFPEIQIGKAA